MRALILAAGMGWRLGGGTEQPPKSLLRFDQQSLLERHIEILFHLGVERIDLGIGYRAEAMLAELDRLGVADRVETVFNPDFEQGNIVTLWRMREHLAGGGDVILMDADVLYDHRMMQRLVHSRHPSCFLLDRDFEPGEEPVKLLVHEGRLVEFGKIIPCDLDHDVIGESIGFFKLSERVAARLAEITAGYVEQGLVEAFYEDALRDLLLEPIGRGVGHEDVTGLPWIEIDFQRDIERAREEILPRLVGLTWAPAI